MFKQVSDLKNTVDTVPSDPVYIGEKKVEEIKFIRTEYNGDEFHRREIKDTGNILGESSPEKTQWLQIIGLHDVELISELGDELKLHPLTIEDTLNMSQHPKLEEFGDYIFINTKNIFMDQEGGLDTEQISFILRDNTLITFEENKSDVFDVMIRRLKEGSTIRRHKSDILLYSLLDAIVDDYFLIVGRISEKIDIVEDELLTNPSRDLLQEIYEIKRNLIYMRKVLWPMRNIVSNISKTDYEDISEKTIYYFRDVYDHIIQMIDIVETYRDICSGMLDTYLSSIGNKTNDVMKVLTIFSTISVPLTFLTGVYGMNFAYQPELKWKYSYLIFWVLSIGITAAMLKYFRDKDWI